MWALRQYMTARDIVKRHKGLTMTHAFFSLMGGFVLVDREQNPAHVLIPGRWNFDYTDLRRLIKTALMADEVKARVETEVTASVKAFIITDRNTAKGWKKVYIKHCAGAATETITDTLTTVGLEVVSKYESFRAGCDDEELLENLLSAIMNAAAELLNRTSAIVVDIYGAEEIYQNATPSEIRLSLWGGLQRDLENKIRERLRNSPRGIQKTLKGDILDKSKQDSLAKSFALAQTTWFGVQCIARRTRDLPLTQLELMTCAYAILSAAIYLFWWYKPFRVDLPIMVQSEIPHKGREKDTFKLNLRDVTTLAKLLQGSVYDGIDFERRLRVPTFYSGFFQDPGNDFWNFFAEIATAAVFGGIHLFAWNYEFPTRTELWIWRVSALVIVGAPPVAFIPISIISTNTIQIPSTRISLSKIFLPILVVLYIIARLLILVLAIVSLRKLPVGTLTDVNWLTFIPHVD
ncbi:hypothetical protein Clacol_001014 [Clathrus columnatus]|uniref:Uncharacterized protein n=1 Tax=Clathrus columnatus TaxID=1419009 RepID=A0AAV5A0T1_9AGAM|nr:hypothetical protein Clacol_001014 [Clathrus columnatus]